MNRVAFLGPQGTFTEEAVWKFGLDDVDLLPVDSPSAALGAVREGEADWAVVAIENSVDGAVTSASDALIEAPGIQIYGETELEINFAIMTRPGTSLDRARTLATHPVAYQQVKQWVAAHIPGAQFQSASSNAAAAKLVADGVVDAAAAPRRAAELFGLDVHAEGVADRESARTRFILAGRTGTPAPRTGYDRTSVVFQLPNEPGTLVGTLQEFAQRGVDLSRIESRPTKAEHNTYNFFVDLLGHIDDAPVAQALRSVYVRASAIEFLGSWPRVRSGDAGGIDAGTDTGAGINPDMDQARCDAADEWVRAVREGN